MMFLDVSITKDCKNLLDSYGEICLRCNACGRIDPKQQYRNYLEVLHRQQAENAAFDNWFPECREIQEMNIKRNAELLAKLIAEIEPLAEQEAQDDHV